MLRSPCIFRRDARTSYHGRLLFGRSSVNSRQVDRFQPGPYTQSDLIYDCGQSLNHAVDMGQVEGAFVQGIGYFMSEEYVTNSDGLVVSDGTWTYKIPTVDTIPKQFNVELHNSGFHKKRVLSSKASGEPPLLLAATVHCATRDAIAAARKELHCSGSGLSSPSFFELEVLTIMPVVKELCGLNNVEKYLETLAGSK